MKKLPISYTDQLNGECWTFYKFAILKASMVAAPWLATHIEFYINENMCGGYGNADCDYYKMRYYSDILSMTKISVAEITDDKIISKICSEIDKEHYVVLYLNLNRLCNKEDISLHEILIYGYNVNKGYFYCPILNGGIFKEIKVPFETVVIAYSDARDYFMQDGWNLLSKRDYYFGITSLCIRNDYRNDNFVADFIDKIDHEVHGKRIIQTDLSENILNNRTSYTGNACIKGLSDHIRNFVEKYTILEIELHRLLRTLKMMYDYRLLFCSSMEWFAQMVCNRNDVELENVITQYKSCANEMQRCYLLLCKYDKTREIRLLNGIINILDNLQKREVKILLEFRELIFNYYYQMNGVPRHQDEDD